MAANGDMLARIFDATTTTLARSGAKGLSMTDVSAEAGIPAERCITISVGSRTCCMRSAYES